MDVEQHVLSFDLILSEIIDSKSIQLNKAEHQQFFQLFQLMAKDFEDAFISRVSAKPTHVDLSSGRIECFAKSELHMRQMSMDNSAVALIKEFLMCHVVPSFRVDETHLVIEFQKIEIFRLQRSVTAGKQSVENAPKKSYSDAARSSSGAESRAASENCSLQKTTQEKQGCSSSTNKFNQLPAVDKRQLQPFHGKMGKATFWLFVPDSVGAVEKIHVIIGGSHIKMKQHETQPLVWMAEAEVKQDSEYHYVVKSGYKLPYSNIFLTLQRKEEKQSRNLLEHSIQRDLFDFPCDLHVVTNGYKALLILALQQIETEADLWCIVKDFESKHNHNLKSCFGSLASDLLKEFCRTASKETARTRAFFLTYIISKVFPQESSFFNSFLPFEQDKCKMILELITNSGFKFVNTEIEETMADTMVAIVKKSVGGQCTWLHFVMHFFQTLSGTCLIRRKQRFSCTHVQESIWKVTVESLLKCLDDKETYDGLLLETVQMLKSSKVALDVLRSVKQIRPAESKLLTNLKNCICTLEKENLKKRVPLTYLSEHVQMLWNTDPSLLQQLAAEFESSILNQFEVKCVDTQHLLNLLQDEIFFCTKESAVRILYKAAASENVDLRLLLLAMTRKQKFLDILNSDSEIHMNIARAWISAATKMKSVSGYDQEWYDHVYKLLDIASDLHDQGLVHKMEDLIHDYFSSSAKQYIANFSSVQDITNMARLLQPSNAVEEKVLQSVHLALEVAALKLVEKQVGWDKDEHIKDLLTVLNSSVLFDECETGKKVLEVIASSKDLTLHNTLLKILSTEKYWKILEPKVVFTILTQWIATAKNHHCKEKAKQKKRPGTTVGTTTVFYLYEYLADLEDLQIPPTCQGVIDEIEIIVKQECEKLSTHQRLQLYELASELRPKAMEFLESHVDSIKSETPSKKELEVWLNRYAETSKLDFGSRSDFKGFQMFLSHLQKHLEKLSSNSDKCEFILIHSNFWLNFYSYKGQREKELQNHEVVKLMIGTIERFSETVHQSTIVLTDFLHLEGIIGNAVALIETVSAHDGFLSQWETLKEGYSKAKENYQLLSKLNSCFLQKVKGRLFLKNDIDKIPQELTRIEERLAPTSCCPMGEMNKQGFFFSQSDLLPFARSLYPFKDLKSFVTLCRKCMIDINKYRTTYMKDEVSNEVDISGLFGEESKSFVKTEEISAVEVVYYIEKKCLSDFKDWLEDVTDYDTTLECAMKFGTEEISQEVKRASQHFGISVSENVVSALEWLGGLKANSQKVKHIKKTLVALDLTSSLTSLESAILNFGYCLSSPEKVTIAQLAETMTELKDLLNETDDDWWAMFAELSNATELIHFIKETLDDDFRNLIDAVEEQSEQTIDESTVSDLIRVKQFLQPIFRQTFDQPGLLFDCIKKSMQKEGKDLSKRINNCAHNVHGLKALYQHVANRGELTKEIINNAMKIGIFIWSLKTDESCCAISLTYRYTKQKGDTGTFSYGSDELSDLRSRALLLSNSEKRDKDHKAKHQNDVLQNFVKAVDSILEITWTVTELHQLGHFDYRTHSHKMHSGNAFLVNLSTLLESRKQTLDEWRSILHSSRQKYNSLNFLYCDQLSLMSDFLLDTCDQHKEQQIKNVLRFVHPGSTVKELRKYQSIGSNKDITGQDKLTLIGSATDEVMQHSKVKRVLFPNSEKFSSQSADVNALVKPGTLYIAHLEIKSTKTIPILLSLYANTMHHFPVPSEVLFCHELTTWEEILLLINRSTRSPELHCISNVERLSSNLQTQLVERLGHLMETADNKYRLAIICRGADHHSIMNYFSSYVHHLAGFDTASLQTCLQTTWPDVNMVTSSVPGLGKTEYIRNLASEKGKRMKTVHISGPVSREILVMQLESRKLTPCDILHLDVGEVDDPNFLDACLFEYIVLGCLCSGTKVVCLPTSFVAIEVANTVQDRLRDSLVVLSSFNRQHLNWTDYDVFVVSSEICSPIQIVCNYLKSYDEGALDSTDIVLSGSASIKPLPPAKCKELLCKHFCSGADLSYSVTEIFVNVLGDQLRKLSNSQFFRVSSLKAMLGSGKPVDVRSKLMKALLDVAKEFACRSVQACRSIQNAALLGVDAVQGSEKSHSTGPKLTQAELMVKRINGMLQWADTNHLLVTFNGIDSQTVSAVYRELSLVPTYIKELFKSQLRRELPDLNNLSQQELQIILERVARSKSQKDKSQNLGATYALTPDNLLKMILILLRIRANIPVVIMGETGCGKTSLIRYLAQMCDTEFKHFSIHAGITVDMIKIAVLDCHDQCLQSPNTTVWLFLDEINTCDHLGLLTEIICHHSCFGKTLSKKLIFIAACNPYRLREEYQIMTAGLEGKVKTDSFSRLIYRVHPLPETMIDYVWDYGTLHKDDEKSYINQMVSKVFPEAEPDWHLKEKIVDLLVASQNFVRKSEKCDWCVSLRDVYRCQMLMTQFLNMLHEKLKHPAAQSKMPCYFNRNDEMIYFCAIVLALAHCYQSRLATSEKRDEYWRECAAVLLGNENRFKELTEMVRYEQLDLLNRMVLPQGIAKNTALCENVFVILVCILNRIPIFLVGKPGCSKSLSVQLIKSNLRGKDSVNSYFQTLPNLYIVSYQGSESSTSEGIMKVFKKAEKYGEANKQHGVLPVVLLDEVGLAEASRFNPLKVLHGLLEPATGQLPEVAVVGISNWSLDAAKMNRAIHLSRPDMDVQELFETGKSISAVTSDPTIQSQEIATSEFDSGTQMNEKTLHALAEAYYRYQEEQLIKNFHGLRDYYSLIKYISRLLSDHENISGSYGMDELKIIQRGLLRNFGGTGYGVSEIFKLFSSFSGASQCPKWSIEEIIKDNLKDKLARHLMLITSGDSALGILLNCLKALDRNYSIIFGSKFEEDQTEDYSYRILSRIILCMETGSVLILKDLDTIYGSLYDMLNQNYTVVGKKKNCRIALGPYSNPMCHVHDDFRCIVLVDENKVNYSDPPFLNRFEKQILRFEEVIADGQKTVIQELEDWMDDFCMMPNLPFVKENGFCGLCADTVPSLVYQVSQGNSYNENNKFLDCQDALLWLVPPDAMLRVTHSEFAIKSTEEIRSIQSRYFERPIHEGLSKFLSVVLGGKSENLPPVFNKTSGIMMVVYTHSNIYIDLQKVLKHHKPIQVEKLGSFKSEKQLTKQIRQFFESDYTLLILQCEPCEDGKHIPLAKFQLEELHQEYEKKSEKHICIVLHMERSTSPSVSASGQFSFLSGWQLAVIDTLEEQENFPLTRTLSMSISDILNTEFCPIEQCIQKHLVWAFTCTNSSYGERSIQEFSGLITQISDSKQMLSCLAECIVEHIKGNENWVDSLDLYDSDTWQVKVACDLRLLHSATSFTDALKLYLMKCVTTPLANLVYRLEKLSAWHSYFRNQETAADIWKSMFWNCNIFRLGEVKIPQGPGSFKISHKPLNLQCPFSQVFITKLCKWEELFKQDLLEAAKDSSEGDDLKTFTYLSLFEKYQGLFESDIAILRELDILKLFEQEFINDICNCLSLGYVLPENDRIQVALWLIGIKSHSHHKVTPEVHLTESLLCLWRYEPLFHALLQLISECRPILPYSVEEMLSKTSSNKLLKEDISEVDSTEGFQSQNETDQVQSEEDFISDTSLKQLFSVNQEYVENDETEILHKASATEEEDFEQAFTAGKEEETLQKWIVSKDKANETSQAVISESTSDSDEDGIYKMLTGQNKELEEPPEPEFLASNNDELSDTDDKENLIKVGKNKDEQLGEGNPLYLTESKKEKYENLEEEPDESVDLHGSEDYKNDQWINENNAKCEEVESGESLEIESGTNNDNVKEERKELCTPECLSDELEFDCDKLEAVNTASIQDNHPDEGSSYFDVPEIVKREGLELNEGEAKSLDEEVTATENETSPTDETSGLHPEERLVHLLCKLLVPTDKVLKECGGFSGWHGRVCSMLSFCSSVSSYPVSFHALRIFNDLATVLFHCKLNDSKIEIFLVQLSGVVDVEDIENSLNSTAMFERVFELYDILECEGISEMDFECFACMYISRIIDINPETELFGQFLLKAAQLELPDKNLSHLEVLLNRVLLEVQSPDKTLFEVLESLILDEGEDLASFFHLEAMDAALREVDLKKSVFLILCVDVIQDTVMKTYAWENLDDVKSSANELLFTFKTAVELIASSETSSLRVAAAVAFVKEFLQHMTEIMVYDLKNQSFADHFVLYQNINTLLSIDEGKNFLLRQLKLNRSFEEVKKLVTSLENVMPVLLVRTLPEDDLSLVLGHKVLGESCEHNASFEALVRQLNSDDKVVRECLIKSKEEKELLCLTEAFLHALFLPNAIRPLTDSEKQVGIWVKDNAALIPHQLLNSLLQRIANVESFGAGLFKVTPEMTYTQLQQASFLLHLISILVVKISLNQNDLLTECLVQPETIFKAKLNSLAMGKCENGARTGTVNCSLVTCKCWSRLIFSGTCENCPICGCKWAKFGVHEEEFLAKNLLPAAEMCYERQSLAVEILRLFIDGSLLCSLALGSLNIEAVKVACEEISDRDTCQTLLERDFEKTWTVLKESLQLNPEEIGLFLHSVVDRIDIFRGNFNFQNIEQLKQEIKVIEANIIKQFLQPSMYFKLKLYQRSVSVTSPKVQQSILELPTEYCEELPNWLTPLFRLVGKRTLADMKAQFYMSEKEKDHPVIDTFFKKGQHLVLLRHLMPLMKWSQLCYQATNHNFSREDGKTLNLAKLILALPELKENLKKTFDQFIESWEELCKEENFSLLRTFDSSLPAQPHAEEVMICENSDSVIYKVLKALVHIQNMFLIELLSIAQSGKCPSLGFLKKNFSDMAAIKSVLLQNLKDDQVIACDFQNIESELTRFAQNILIFGFGSQACYNFVKIEMELANMLSLGKTCIVVNETFPFVTYANEMFVACASVLREFKLIVPQKPLGQSVKDGIEEKMKNNRDLVNQMMRQTEILLCLAKKTGGSPDQTLKNYNQSWLKTLPGGFSEQNLVFEGEPLCLSHLVALYEFLENLQADAAIKSMPQEFRIPLPKAVEKELKDFADTNHIELSSIQVAFRRFIMRHLVNFNPEKINLDAPLTQWMAEPSLWPEGVKENGELEINKEGGTPKTVKTAFPQMLNLEHTFCALTYIGEMIEERTKQRAKWLPVNVERKHVTGTASSATTKTQQGRQRTRGRIGKT